MQKVCGCGRLTGVYHEHNKVEIPIKVGISDTVALLEQINISPLLFHPAPGTQLLNYKSLIFLALSVKISQLPSHVGGNSVPSRFDLRPMLMHLFTDLAVGRNLDCLWHTTEHHIKHWWDWAKRIWWQRINSTFDGLVYGLSEAWSLASSSTGELAKKANYQTTFQNYLIQNSWSRWGHLGLWFYHLRFNHHCLRTTPTCQRIEDKSHENSRICHIKFLGFKWSGSGCSICFFKGEVTCCMLCCSPGYSHLMGLFGFWRLSTFGNAALTHSLGSPIDC